jgi:hypothetical protein
MILWDCVNGLQSINSAGDAAIAELLTSTGAMQEITVSLSESLTMFYKVSDNAHSIVNDTIVFISNSQLFWADTTTLQAIWNLRDKFKKFGNMLVLLCDTGAILPAILVHDVLVLDEPLPSAVQLAELVRDVCSCTTKPLTDSDEDKAILQDAVTALIGLPAFPADQSTAMSLNASGELDLIALWDRKRQAINQTNGLSVGTGKESLSDIGGLEPIKSYMEKLINGNDAPSCIIFIDEIEKAFAGTGTDTSGVKTELTGSMLSWMQDTEMQGVLFIGVPGGGKSQLGKAIAATHNKPFIKFDIAGMQSGLVGSSGANLRAAIATVNAVSGGKVLCIATCNSIGALPPELRRRFKDGTFFFDAPTAEERASIWKVYRERYHIAETDALPTNTGWTGAEIKECCSKAYRLRVTLQDAAQFIVPVTVSSADTINTLREASSGKFLSASYTGIYRYDRKVELPVLAQTTGRKMRVE